MFIGTGMCSRETYVCMSRMWNDILRVEEHAPMYESVLTIMTTAARCGTASRAVFSREEIDMLMCTALIVIHGGHTFRCRVHVCAELTCVIDLTCNVNYDVAGLQAIDDVNNSIGLLHTCSAV